MCSVVPEPTPAPQEPAPEERGAGAGAPGLPGAGEAPTVTKEYWVKEEKTKYKVTWTENGIEVTVTYYPIYPYFNHVKKVLRSYYKNGSVCLEVYQVRQSWHGTGRDDVLDLCFDDHSTESPIFMWRTEVESIKDAVDIKEYVKGVVEWLTNLIREVGEFMLGG